MKAIEKGQTITARSIGDYNCVFTAKVIDRKGSFATIKVEGEKEAKRVKVYQFTDGKEFVYAMGRYSMAPMFSNRF